MKKRNTTSLIFSGSFALALLLTLSGWLLKSEILPRHEEDEQEIEACGVERWAQKVLTDADTSKINFTAKSSTIKGLITIATPSVSSNTPRQPQEYQLYKVHCLMTKLKLEDDGDYHLVLADSIGNTMIGEIPDPTCSSTKPSHHLSQFTNSRNFIDKHYKVTTSFINISAKVVVTGMAFIDPPHGQTGAAPNNLELHSILDIYYDTAKPVSSSIALETKKEPKLVIYPNPAHDVINLGMTGIENAGGPVFTLYNANGKEIMNVAIPSGSNSYSFGRGDLANGMYYYSLKAINKETISGRLLLY